MSHAEDDAASATGARPWTAADLVAEGVGFEPTEGRNPQRLSRPSHSSALASFRAGTLEGGGVGPSARSQAGRCPAKKSVRSAAHSSARTPCVTGGLWLRRGSANTL